MLFLFFKKCFFAPDLSCHVARLLVTACGILVPQSGIELARLALGAQSLSHGPTREVPLFALLFAPSCWHFSCHTFPCSLTFLVLTELPGVFI